MLAAVLFDTPRERLEKIHKAMAAAIDAKDAASLVAILDPSFVAPDLDNLTAGNAEIVLGQIFKQFSPHETRIISLVVEIRAADSAVSYLNIMTTLDFGPTTSKWQFTWARCA